MSVAKIKELREKRAAIHAEAMKISELPVITKEDRAKFDAQMIEVDTLKADIDRLERALKVDAELRETVVPPREKIPGQDRAAENSPEVRKAKDEKYRRAYSEYLRLGPRQTDFEPGMSEESREALRVGRTEYRDMGIGTNTLGGYFVPQGFVYDIESAMKWYGDMLNQAEILDTASGQPLPYPTDNDTSNTGEIVGEGQQVSDQDVTVGHINFNAFKFSTKMVKVSIELIQDSAFDMEGFLKNKFAIRLGRILNTKMTVGAGSTEPLGILTAVIAACGAPAVGGGAYGIPVIAAGSSANTGGAETGGTSIGTKDLIALEHSIDPAYRSGAKYMFHDTLLRGFQQLLDKYGRPLWVPGVAANAPDKVNGYAYSVNNDMPQSALSANTVIFGNLKKYMIRRVKELGILRLTERFADYGQIAFIGFARYDGNLLDAGTHPVCYLQQANA
jgi:HK97 family phage major capsid protein